MAFFRGRDVAGRVAQAQRENIAAFWQWWEASGAIEVATAVADGDLERAAPALTTHAHAVHSRLQWQVTPGVQSRHLLVVGAGGDPRLRGPARRWLRSAPGADGLWEFSDARPAAADPAAAVVTVEGVDVDLPRASAAARVVGAGLTVTVHHPAFAALAEGPRAQAAFLLLEAALGESDVETWLGAVSTTVAPPIDPVPLSGLRYAVNDLRARFTDADGTPTWITMNGTATDGQPVSASAQVPLRASFGPDYDTHVRVRVPFTDRVDGLPGPESRAPIDALERRIDDALADAGRVVARETHGGARTLHVYVDGTTPALDRLRAATGDWSQGGVKVTATPDPSWSQVLHLRA